MVIIRQEKAEDISAIRNINEAAFGRKEEGEIVDKMRNRGAMLLSLVAEEEDRVVGHIMFCQADTEPELTDSKIAILGPVAVLPECQRKGIGSKLILSGLEECRRLDYDAVVLAGHADYYPRFGFRPAKARGVACEVEVPDEAWMVKELNEGALSEINCKILFPREFHEAM